MHVELDAAKGDEPAAAILFDFALRCRLEVLAIKPWRVCGRSEKTRPEQQHGSKRRLARRAREREPRSSTHHIALGVKRLIFPIAQATLPGIVEEEIRVVLVVVNG